jgi:hypothetical protein
MGRLLCLMGIIIVFIACYGCPALAASGDPVGGGIGGHHPEIIAFASLDHPVLERGKDAVGGGLGPD